MQMYVKENSDTRTFPEIWETLSIAEQQELRYELTRRGDCTRASVYNWSKGVCPISIALRKKVAEKINKLFGLNVSHLNLFPLEKTNNTTIQ